MKGRRLVRLISAQAGERTRREADDPRRLIESRYYRRHRERILARQTAYRAANPGRLRDIQRRADVKRGHTKGVGRGWWRRAA